MLIDTRELPTGALDPAANQALCEGLECLLGAQTGAEAALQSAIALDPDCTLAHAALARHHQMSGQMDRARAALQRALDGLSSETPTSMPVARRQVPDRVQGVTWIFERLLAGDAPGALHRVRAHLSSYPTDVLAMAPAAGVFGLFGFSGSLRREADLLAFLESYRSHCSHDWWYQSALAFALVETGQIDRASAQIERSVSARPQSANGAHIRTHVAYEAGDHLGSAQWLERWLGGYGREGLMHCHLGWHLALAALETGDTDRAWQMYRDHVQPGVAWGPPLNLLTDSVSFLARIQWAGGTVSQADWHELSGLACRLFPRAGASFADLHVVLAHAMAGERERLATYQAELPGHAGDLVAALARGLQSLIDGAPADALQHWERVLEQNVRLGGSRAQRDLIVGLASKVGVSLGKTPDALRYVRPSRLDSHD